MAQNYRTTLALKTKAHMAVRRQKVTVEGALCQYSHRVCMQKKLDGFDYCLRHILEDKNSPYKQCTYVSNKNGKRCHNAALKTDKKDGQCIEHAKKMVMSRMKANQKKKPKETAETLLEQIEHYSSGHQLPGTSDGRRARPSADNVTSRILDYGSSSDSDTDQPLVDQAWRGDVESDAESIDSDQEDPLRHASVYTAEEVALITRDKLIRLQSLYIDQFKRLQHILKEKRRRYLHARRAEKDTLGTVTASKNDPEQKALYDKLVAMKRYHKRFGKEALLQRQSKERRIAASEGASFRPPSFTKCVHVNKGVKCGHKVVPLMKFCTEHVLQDHHQVLFRACGFGEGACRNPIPAVEGESRCTSHVILAEVSDRLASKEEPQDNVSRTITLSAGAQLPPGETLEMSRDDSSEKMDTSVSSTGTESAAIDVVGESPLKKEPQSSLEEDKTPADSQCSSQTNT